jgi:hypothetical protein
MTFRLVEDRRLAGPRIPGEPCRRYLLLYDEYALETLILPLQNYNVTLRKVTPIYYVMLSLHGVMKFSILYKDNDRYRLFECIK